ncbi:MAG: hypothetical protein JSU66_01480 [Deltaproteobacteria bacterium]|nr:MAG: hypothetical protein JSU66_01480 [Deltaproteobacteria bacterium]
MGARVTRSAFYAYRTLAVEAILDAVRRRIVMAIAVVTLLALWLVRGCAACTGGSYRVDGQLVDPGRIAGFTGVALYALLALWTMTLAGLLASDHLSQSLHDGSAPLTLARPVGRGTYALARLSGSLAVALVAGGVLLTATAGLLHARHALPLGPAFAGAAVCAWGALLVAALAMSASLVLPRLATFLCVLGFVGFVTGVNLAARAGAPLSGVSGLVDRFGPPLGSALLEALGPWIGRTPSHGPVPGLSPRLVLWAVASVILLVAAFRRVEIRS